MACPAVRQIGRRGCRRQREGALGNGESVRRARERIFAETRKAKHPAPCRDMLAASDCRMAAAGSLESAMSVMAQKKGESCGRGGNRHTEMPHTYFLRAPSTTPLLHRSGSSLGSAIKQNQNETSLSPWSLPPPASAGKNGIDTRWSLRQNGIREVTSHNNAKAPERRRLNPVPVNPAIFVFSPEPRRARASARSLCAVRSV
jgi:hypothetical protein